MSQDKGAHFYRCDFQVHTPRDRNWRGSRPTTDDERNDFSDNFVRECRARGINAVAITDHHDIVFYPFIKRAAENELDDTGNPIPPENRLVVFPGMELTLSVPCQALIILDADFPIDFLSNLPTILSITPSPPSDPQTAEVQPLEFTSISELYDRLDQFDNLRNHYIILPHVQDGGHRTILRSGFSPHYRDMPCVGGYLDGSFERLGQGNRDILEGKNREYGFKALGVFQTSDSRREDFEQLGVHTSWAKWALPTAEALRQACLARKTRISNEEPQIPPVVIQSIEVSNSKFMGPINLHFNPQFNSLIGGRGTGKSTILEYLRWALCDQPPRTSEEEEVPDFEAKRASLIENTLRPLGSVVTVDFLLNRVPHTIRRISNTGALLLKFGEGEFQECDNDDINRLLPIQSYSQKQLSAVSVRRDELQRLVRAPVENQLSDFHDQEIELKVQLRALYGRINSKLELEKQLARERLELRSLSQRVATLRNQLHGLSSEDQATIASHELIQEEERLVGICDQGYKRLFEIIEVAQREVSLLTIPSIDNTGLPHRQLVQDIKTQYETMIQAYAIAMDSLAKRMNKSGDLHTSFQKSRTTWTKELSKHSRAYEAAKNRASAHRTILQQIAGLDERIRELSTAVTEKEQSIASLGNPNEQYEQIRDIWISKYVERGDLLEAECRKITELSDNRIRASLSRGAVLSKVQEMLKDILSGTRIRTNKIDDLCEIIRTSMQPVEKWLEAVAEFERIAHLEISDEPEAEFPSLTILSRAGFTDSDIRKLSEKLTVEAWVDLSLVELEDEITFEYQQREGDYIVFSEASAGQQATALLKILLNQEGPPPNY
ncbi:AAA family ATPase [Gemmatimonadota bacterium]